MTGMRTYFLNDSTAVGLQTESQDTSLQTLNKRIDLGDGGLFHQSLHAEVGENICRKLQDNWADFLEDSINVFGRRSFEDVLLNVSGSDLIGRELRNVPLHVLHQSISCCLEISDTAYLPRLPIGEFCPL